MQMGSNCKVAQHQELILHPSGTVVNYLSTFEASGLVLNPSLSPSLHQACLHSTNSHQNLHGHYENSAASGETTRIAAILCPEPLRKPVWKLQACVSEPDPEARLTI